MTDTMSADVLGLTAQIVAAHVGHNAVASDALPALIQSVYQALVTVETAQAEPALPQAPAVPIRKSVFPEFIVCLEDGKKLKMLKRHLLTSYNMTPAEYREKWKLPKDYPMVAPSYASHRSSLAKQAGLGRKPALERSAEQVVEIEPEQVEDKPAKARARRKAPATKAGE